MKIDATARIKESLALEVPFDGQLAEAKTSGRRFSTAVLPDGQRAVYYHTDAEIEHAKTYASIRTPRVNVEAELSELKTRMAELERKSSAGK